MPPRRQYDQEELRAIANEFGISIRAARARVRRRLARESGDRQVRENERERLRDLRESETLGARLERNQTDSQRHRESRDAESEERQSLRRDANATQMRHSRDEESVETSSQRRLANARRMQDLRAGESEEENRQRLSALQNRAERRRSARPPTFKSALFDSIESFVDDVAAFHVPYLGDSCRYCGALRMNYDTAGSCCRLGRVTLSPFHEPSDEIRGLYEGSGSESREFRKMSRWLNNALAFSLQSCKEEPAKITRPQFKICGRAYQLMAPLFPEEGMPPRFQQLYFNDPEHETENRLADSPIDRMLLSILQSHIHNSNRLYRELKTCAEIARGLPESVVVLDDGRNRPNGAHPRRYNRPTGNEVAAVYSVDPAGRYPGVVVHTRGSDCTIIAPDSCMYEPAGYVLIYLYGEDGWTFRNQVGAHRVSIGDYTRYLLYHRERFWNPSLLCGKLRLQWILDQRFRQESLDLNFLCLNQGHLRADSYQSIAEAINADLPLGQIGSRTILPASHTGSPRWYKKQQMNALALLAEFGKPDYFLTMTCNPEWSSIVEKIPPADLVTNHPDIVARVFYNKLTELIRVDLLKNQVLGEVSALVYSIEWQKRGLPHCHVLIFMHDSSRLDTGCATDTLISAEIPTQPRLRELVLKHMIHNRCGIHNPSAVCMVGNGVNRKCSKEFPKAFSTSTVIGESCWPAYKRRSEEDGGETATIRTRGPQEIIDNRWVVPYNPYLLSKYKCHLNIEKVASTRTVSYLFKYALKGEDRVMFRLDPSESADQNARDRLDEIKYYQDHRYLSSSEAAWRLLQLPIHYQEPPCLQLELFAEDLSRVIVDPNLDGTQQLDRIRSRSTLKAWFTLNQEDSRANSILYPDIPKYYRFTCVDGVYKYVARVRGGIRDPNHSHLLRANVVTRLPNVSPSNPHTLQIFALKCLLYHIPGAKREEDLRTVDGQLFDTLYQAAVAIGLMNDAEEHERAMEEAYNMLSMGHCRYLFTMLLIRCTPAEPRNFYDAQKVRMTSDITQRRIRRDPASGVQMTDADEQKLLECIDRILGRNGYSLEDFGLPQISGRVGQSGANVFVDIDTLDSDAIETGVSSLNAAQREIFDAVLESAVGSQGGAFFLDAPGGTGKTFVIKSIIGRLCLRGYKVIATASSGVASTLLPDGQTLHSAFRIPLKCTEASYSAIAKQSRLARDIAEANLLIWDEAPMMTRNVMECLDRSLRDLRDNANHLFGGLTVLMSGDWRQILPVVANGSIPTLLSSLLKRSHLWGRVRQYHLTDNLRITEHNELGRQFNRFLLELGEGKLEDFVEPGRIQLPGMINIIHGNIAQLCSAVFPDMGDNYCDGDWLARRSILCSTNNMVDSINDTLLDRIPGEAFISLSAVEPLRKESMTVMVPPEVINRMEFPGMPPHVLRLKRGAQVILLRNIDSKAGHCNGTKYTVVDCSPRLLKVEISSGPRRGTMAVFPRITLTFDEDTSPIKFKRTQFPFRLAFALTIHKAQGQTIDNVGLYLKGNGECFTHGQLYVALSRASSPSNIYVLLDEDNGDRSTTNVVYRQALD